MIAKAELLRRLADPKDALLCRPFPDEKDVGNGTINLRVGCLFLSADRSSLAAVHADDPSSAEQLFDLIHVDPSEPFVMHPRQFVLAATLEYLVMPSDMAGLIQSRSTYGRMGIISATAAYVNPGYKGSPTLELVNASEVPIILKPYEPISQVIFIPAHATELGVSRYHAATRAVFARKDRRHPEAK